MGCSGEACSCIKNCPDCQIIELADVQARSFSSLSSSSECGISMSSSRVQVLSKGLLLDEDWHVAAVVTVH